MNKTVFARKLPVAHAITDLHGRFISVDDSFCALLHRERHEILNHTILSLTAEEYRPLNAEKLDLLRNTGTSFMIRKTYIRADGGLQPVENIVGLTRDRSGNPNLTATIRPLEVVPDATLSAHLRVARLLLRERSSRFSSGLAWSDGDLALMLSAYTLEIEGSQVWAADLANVASGDWRANLLRVWELVSDGVFVVDGTAATLEQASIRLSLEHSGLIERHLSELMGDP